MIIIGFPLLMIFSNMVCIYIFPFNSMHRYMKKGENNNLAKYLRMIYGPNWRDFQN